MQAPSRSNRLWGYERTLTVAGFNGEPGAMQIGIETVYYAVGVAIPVGSGIGAAAMKIWHGRKPKRTAI